MASTTTTEQEIIKALEASILSMPAKDVGFATSLVKTFKQYGSLSPKQWYWAKKLAGAEPKTDVEAIAIPHGASLVAWFKEAKVKHPAVTIQTAHGPVRLKLCGAKSKKPGALAVTDGGPYGANQFYGYVHPSGVFSSSSGVPVHVGQVLKGLATDPIGYVAEHGKKSGACVFCGKSLTDDTSGKSLEVGYGPTCAKNYGLPFGKKAVAKAKDKATAKAAAESVTKLVATTPKEEAVKTATLLGAVQQHIADVIATKAAADAEKMVTGTGVVTGTVVTGTGTEMSVLHEPAGAFEDALSVGKEGTFFAPSPISPSLGILAARLQKRFAGTAMFPGGAAPLWVIKVVKDLKARALRFLVERGGDLAPILVTVPEDELEDADDLLGVIDVLVGRIGDALWQVWEDGQWDVKKGGAPLQPVPPAKMIVGVDLAAPAAKKEPVCPRCFGLGRRVTAEGRFEACAHEAAQEATT